MQTLCQTFHHYKKNSQVILKAKNNHRNFITNLNARKEEIYKPNKKETHSMPPAQLNNLLNLNRKRAHNIKKKAYIASFQRYITNNTLIKPIN